MTQVNSIPPDYEGIQVVSSMDEMFAAKFGPANVILYPRVSISVNFDSLACWMGQSKELFHYNGVLSLEFHALQTHARTLNGEEREAAQAICEDMGSIFKARKEARNQTFLRAIDPRKMKYPLEGGGAEKFHGDNTKTTVHPSQRLLCPYNTPTTEGLRNQDVWDTSFGFVKKPWAHPFSMPLRAMWRQAVQYKAAPVLPFIHRSPPMPKEGPPRLLLVSSFDL